MALTVDVGLQRCSLGGVFAQLDAGALGATIRGINIRDLKRTQVTVAPHSEQVAIADFIDQRVSKVSSLASRTRDIIDLLREQRQALITAAMTGQIDVREELTRPTAPSPKTARPREEALG
jgi:type I restriction enzyme S subunit